MVLYCRVGWQSLSGVGDRQPWDDSPHLQVVLKQKCSREVFLRVCCFSDLKHASRGRHRLTQGCITVSLCRDLNAVLCCCSLSFWALLKV